MFKRPAEMQLRAYGVTVAVSAPDTKVLGRLIGQLPPTWAVAAPGPGTEEPAAHVAIRAEGRRWRVLDGRGGARVAPDLELALCTARTQLRRAVAAHPRELVCLDAGVVSHAGLGIILPGQPLAGTSTLVAALVRAGASYHTDELAMLDPQGRLLADVEHSQDSRHASQRIPVGLVALTSYRPGSPWAPVRLTPAEGMAALMGCTTGARDTPAKILTTLRLALEAAPVIRGDRGEAGATAAELLRTLHSA